jgi:DNA-binding NarL/FixJ family response regulator
MDDRQEHSILIASSSPANRNALKLFLSEQSGNFVVAEAGDSHELLKKFESTSADVVLLDWDLLDRSTPILIKTISAHDQNTAIIVLSPGNDHEQVAMDAGADAFVNIGDPPKELSIAINKVINLQESKD